MPELKLANSIVDDRYQVERCLSHGSYAEIFIAKDLAQGQAQVIIKALNAFLQGTPDPDLERTLIENFQNEAIALDKVRHPNIIRRLGHGTAADLEQTPFHYLVLEYMPGGDLLSICRTRPLDLLQMISYLRQISGALSFAHSRQVIHRDVKPNNLLLSADRVLVKIADFGVAKIAASESDEITRVGTNLYAPPEHHPDSQTSALRGSLTPSADVYSLAKTIFTAMTGRSPQRFIREPIASLPEELISQPWGPGLLAILNKATSTEIESRYQSIDEFWDCFSRLAGSAQIAGAGVSDPEMTLVRSRGDGRQPISCAARHTGSARPDNAEMSYDRAGADTRGSAGIGPGSAEAAVIAAGSCQTEGESERSSAREEISQPVFRPHAAASSSTDQSRPQKARIVIDLPERAGSRSDRAAPLPQGSIDPGRAAALHQDSIEGRQARTITHNPTQTAVAAETASQAQLRASATRPIASPPEQGMLDRIRRNIQWSVWVRRMFVIFLVAALVGLTATIYLHFANPDGDRGLTGILGGSYRDGSIAGAPNVYLRSEPDGDPMTMLPAGTRVRVLEERSNWARVKILHWEGTQPADAPDTGWVHRRLIRLD